LLLAVIFGSGSAPIAFSLALYGRPKLQQFGWVALGAAGLIAASLALPGLLTGYFWLPWQ